MAALGLSQIPGVFSTRVEVALQRTPSTFVSFSRKKRLIVAVFPSHKSDPPVPSSVTYKRSAIQSHFECQTTLESLGLKNFSSKQSRSLATSMGVPSTDEAGTSTPVGVSFDVTKDKDSGNLKLNGIAKTAVLVLCDRCLSPHAVRVFSPFSVLLSRTPVEEPKEQTIGVVLGEEPEPGVPVLDIDLDSKLHFPDDAKVMDLSSYIRDTVHLDVPYFSICSTSCKGLCTRCGLNLNTKECRCRDDESDDDDTVTTSLKTKSRES